MNLKMLSAISCLALSLQAEGKSLKIHEWGTFTSFQNSYGGSIEGIHRGDQVLPDFVYLRNPNFAQPAHTAEGCRRTSYACDFDPYAQEKGSLGLGVNERMETPVIYFYSGEPQQVSVQVDFPQGLITEWYPAADSFQPGIGMVNQIAGGSMVWKVQVHTDRLELPAVAANSIWRPSREVPANDISVGNENERLIFYRGVGKFTTPFTVHSEALDFAVENIASEFPQAEIRDILYVRTDGQSGFVKSLGGMGAPGYRIFQYEDTASQAMLPLDQYLSQAMGLLIQSLERSGLTREESTAMANTWKQAYLQTPGERFLYILPRTWTEKLLPMTLSPQPDELVRTLVGRVEVMNRNALNDLFTVIEGHVKAQTPVAIVNKDLGGFSEQKMMLVRDRAEEVFKQRLGNVLNNPVETARVEQEHQAFQDYVDSLLQLIRF